MIEWMTKWMILSIFYVALDRSEESGLCPALWIRIHMANDSIYSDNSINLALYTLCHSPLALYKKKITELRVIIQEGRKKKKLEKKKLLKLPVKNCQYLFTFYFVFFWIEETFPHSFLALFSHTVPISEKLDTWKANQKHLVIYCLIPLSQTIE